MRKRTSQNSIGAPAPPVSALGVAYELLLVNDGSKDGTALLLDALAQEPT